MEALINDYFSREIEQDVTLLLHGDETSLFASGVLSSPAPLTLVMLIQEQFGIPLDDVDLHPENFDSVNAISSYLRYGVSGRAVQAGAPWLS